MSRYDRIKVFHNNQWKTPNDIKVYNGTTWVSLGGNEEHTHTGKELKVKKDNNWVRVTNDWINDTTTVVDYVQSNGSINILDAKQYCYCPSAPGSDAWLNKKWRFHVHVKKDSNSNYTLLSIRNNSGYGENGTHIKVVWQSDGKIYVEAKYTASGTLYSIISNHAVNANTWLDLDIVQDKDSDYMHIYMNGQETSRAMYGAFAVSNVDGVLGSDGVHFKDNIYLEGGTAASYTGYATLNSPVDSLWTNKTTVMKTIDNSHWEN